jgi:hypothetical protein
MTISATDLKSLHRLFVEVFAAMDHELRKVGTSILLRCTTKQRLPSDGLILQEARQ